MSRLFRNIRKGLLGSRKFKQYLTYAFGEIILIMLGVLLAIGVNNWNNKRIDLQTELKSYQNIKRQLLEDKQVIQKTIRYNQNYLEQFQYAIQIIGLNDKNQSDSLGYITLKLTKYSDFDRRSNIYETLVNSGNIHVLRNEEIKEGLQRLEETYHFFNRMETIHYDVIKSSVPEVINYIKYADRTIQQPEMIYSFRFQNVFITIAEIMKEKDEIYTKAVNQINAINLMIDKELITK